MSDSSTPKHVLVPTDGSPQSERALDFALTFDDARITLLTVVDPVDIDPSRRAISCRRAFRAWSATRRGGTRAC